MINISLLKLAIDTAVKAGEATLKYYHQDVDVMVKDDNSPLTKADLESNRIINEGLNETGIDILSEENKQIDYADRKDWSCFWLIDPVDGTKEFINKRSEYTINIALVENGIPVLGVVYAPVLKIIYFGMKEFGSYKLTIQELTTPDTIINNAKRLEVSELPSSLRVVASRSHMSDETRQFIDSLSGYKSVAETKSIGSSLKLCLVAEGEADIYPRLGPTMEWDTAAANAVVLHAGCKVISTESLKPLAYNKENLLNPYFIVYHPELDGFVMEILKK